MEDEKVLFNSPGFAPEFESRDNSGFNINLSAIVRPKVWLIIKPTFCHFIII